jgi:hypothetical protein
MPEKGKPLDLSELSKLVGKPVEMLAAIGTYLTAAEENFTPTDLRHSLQYLNGTVVYLREDSDRCYTLFADSFRRWLADSKNTELHKEFQFNVRQLIRTFFAEVDGTLFAMRQVVLWAHERGELDLSPAEVAVLREETYRFNPRNRQVEAKDAFNSTKDSFLIAFTYLPRLLVPAFKLGLSDNGWECFQRLLDVRHELTHPKRSTRFVVDSEIITTTLPRARVWYYELLKEAVGLK